MKTDEFEIGKVYNLFRESHRFLYLWSWPNGIIKTFFQLDKDGNPIHLLTNEIEIDPVLASDQTHNVTLNIDINPNQPKRWPMPGEVWETREQLRVILLSRTQGDIYSLVGQFYFYNDTHFHGTTGTWTDEGQYRLGDISPEDLIKLSDDQSHPGIILPGDK